MWLSRQKFKFLCNPIGCEAQEGAEYTIILYKIMTGENSVSWLAQFVCINLNVYLKTGPNWPTCVYRMKTS